VVGVEEASKNTAKNSGMSEVSGKDCSELSQMSAGVLRCVNKAGRHSEHFM